MLIVVVFPSNILFLQYHYRGKSLWKSSILKINVPNRLNCVLQFVNIQFCLRISDHVMFSFFQLLSYPRAYVCKTYNKRQISLSYVETGVTLLVNKSQHCWMLHVGSVCTPCCILLDVVACCCAKFKTCQTFSTVQTGATLLGVVSSVCRKLNSRELFLSNVFLSMCICMQNL